MTTTTLIISDTHINSTVALCPPAVQLDDGGTHHISPFQRKLWGCWLDCLEQVERKKRGDLYVMHGGDAVEGDCKRRSYQTITRNTATILRIAAQALDPLVQMATGFYMMRGTPAHVGKSGNLEEILAHDLGAVVDEETGASSRNYLNWQVDGVRMVISHHPRGGAGGRPMNRYSGIDRIASDTLFAYANAGEKPVDLVINSHLHQYLDSGDRFRTRAIITPSWMLARDDYVFRTGIAPLAVADIGAVLVYTDRGRYEVETLLYQPEKRKWTSASPKMNS